MKMLSLFSGIGGIDLAAEWAGIDTVAFCEKDKFCQKVLAKHWPNVPCYDDIKTLKGSEILARHGNIDIVAGGFPCQPFSLAGKRGGEQDERHLWPEMCRIIHEIRPTWVIGENVPGLISLGLEQVLVDLENEGYEAQTFNIPACAVNAPHKRARIFIIAYTESKQNRGLQLTGIQPDVGTGNKYVAYASIEREGRLSIRPWRSLETASDIDGGRENVSYADGARREERDATAEPDQSGFGSGRGNAGDVSEPGSERQTERGNRRLSEVAENEGSRPDNRGRTESHVGGEWWDVEPGIRRVVDGVPNRTHRLKALGNAVVPQQIYPIFKIIAEIEKLEATK